MITLEHYRKRLDHCLANYQYAQRSLDNESKALDRAKQQEADTLTAQSVLQGIAEAVQQKAHDQIASVVTRCLEAVFGDDAYEFRIEFKQARGKTEARLLFIRDGMELDPVDASGGGVVDVASFALRLSCLVLSSPAQRKILVMDEPWKWVSAEYRPAMARMAELLAKELGVQFIIVSHCPEFKMGKVIEME